jgi:uncharacterized protein (UPF0332 family)
MTAPVAIVDGYMRKAERALGEARLLMSRQATEGACSRAYYAMHDAAHAALFATGFETPEAIIKTHHSLIAAFGKHLVLGGLIDANAGRALNKVEEIRLLADYGADPPPLVDAQSALDRADAFVAAVRRLIGGLEP